MQAITGVVSQPLAIPPSTLKFIFLAPFRMPIPRMAPTMTCELETGTRGIAGSPRPEMNSDSREDEKINSTSECESTTISAASALNSKIFLPTVFITLSEYVNMPAAIANPPSRNSCCALSRLINPRFILPKFTAGTNTPMTLAILFAPRLYDANAPTIIRQVRIIDSYLIRCIFVLLFILLIRI